VVSGAGPTVLALTAAERADQRELAAACCPDGWEYAEVAPSAGARTVPAAISK
jgi:hypothetical protein